MKKRYVFRTEKELEGLRWTTRVIDFGVSLTIIAALNELTTAYIMLRERKDLFRHNVKRMTNETMQVATNLRTSIMSVMKKGDFFDTYSDRVIDLAENDITMFRISIKQTLDDNGVEDAELLSYIETARTLLEMAAEHFDSAIRAAKEDFKIDYTKAFTEFMARPVLDRWERVCNTIYPMVGSIADVDLNTKRNLAIFEKLGAKFADGDFIQECLHDAIEEHPDFMNDIEVKEA